MKKTIEILKTLSDTEIRRDLNQFIDESSVALALSKECRDHLADRGIYGPYKKLNHEVL